VIRLLSRIPSTLLILCHCRTTLYIILYDCFNSFSAVLDRGTTASSFGFLLSLVHNLLQIWCINNFIIIEISRMWRRYLDLLLFLEICPFPTLTFIDLNIFKETLIVHFFGWSLSNDYFGKQFFIFEAGFCLLVHIFR